MKKEQNDPLRAYKFAGISLLQWLLILGLVGTGLTIAHHFHVF